MRIPPILLEGDASSVPEPHLSGPGQRYTLGTLPPAPSSERAVGTRELPESYGTDRLFLTARDPHWLYAAWDLRREERLRYNRLSADGHLLLRTYINAVCGEPLRETHVHPESRSWFIQVGRGGTKYVAELGYRGADGQWHAIARSGATLTPPDRVSDRVAVQFATLPAETKFEEVVAVVRELVAENVPIIEAIQQLRAEGFTDLPEFTVAAPREEKPWTPAQAEALAKVVALDEGRGVWVGSLEITELVRRQLEEQVSSLSAAEVGRRGEGAPPTARVEISSPAGRVSAEKRRGFWFNVNAELVIYGATERDARLAVGGRQVRLRSDGTFSFRFALPDGSYELPVTAVSSDGEERRTAGLSFARSTQYSGEVGAHPQDTALKPPVPASIA